MGGYRCSNECTPGCFKGNEPCIVPTPAPTKFHKTFDRPWQILSLTAACIVFAGVILVTCFKIRRSHQFHFRWWVRHIPVINSYRARMTTERLRSQLTDRETLEKFTVGVNKVEHEAAEGAESKHFQSEKFFTANSRESALLSSKLLAEKETDISNKSFWGAWKLWLLSGRRRRYTYLFVVCSVGIIIFGFVYWKFLWNGGDTTDITSMLDQVITGLQYCFANATIYVLHSERKL